MATLLEKNELFSSPNLRDRTKAAIREYAGVVLAEDAGTDNHANRVIWAVDSLDSIDAATKRMLSEVVNNPTIQDVGDVCSDNDIKFVVNESINKFAVGA